MCNSFRDFLSNTGKVCTFYQLIVPFHPPFSLCFDFSMSSVLSGFLVVTPRVGVYIDLEIDYLFIFSKWFKPRAITMFDI